MFHRDLVFQLGILLNKCYSLYLTSLPHPRLDYIYLFCDYYFNPCYLSMYFSESKHKF